jgi:hypothetical protein
LQYIPDVESSFLPEYFRDEYKWLQRQKWLRSEKTFHDPITFVLAHLACLAERGAFDIEPVSFHLHHKYLNDVGQTDQAAFDNFLLVVVVAENLY